MDLSKVIIVINSVCILLIMFLNVICSYKNFRISMQNKSMPLIVNVVNNINENVIKKSNGYRKICKLHVCEDSISYTRIYYYKKYTLVMVIVIVINVLSIGIALMTQSKNQLINNQYILKPPLSHNKWWFCVIYEHFIS